MEHHKSLCDIIIFGGHGDLSFRKLLPALYHLYKEAYLSPDSRIVVISRRDMTQAKHVELLRSKMKEFLRDGEYDEEIFSEFIKRIVLCNIDFDNEKSFEHLKKTLDKEEKRDRIYYLSTSSDFFGSICKSLSAFKLIKSNSRVVLEKPIGRDLESSQSINKEVLKYFKENQVYRIDHYLGKDTVQNILALRFSNRFFMPLWDANNIDHVQITVSESVGVEGRWGYYDDYGALRDMIQNHLLQLLCLIAMEPPCSLASDSIRDEKVKVLHSLRNMTPEDIRQRTVRAQYKSGSINGEPVVGYLDAEGADKNSNTETFAALRVDIDNWRWIGVPFYLRSGKRMSKKNSEIVIQFKKIPYSIFPNNGNCITENKLVITLQPKESISLKLMNKIPEITEQMRLQQVDLELNAPKTNVGTAEAYQRLILDVIHANPTLFMRLDEVEAAWRWTDIILEGWAQNFTTMKTYSAGTDGPSASIQLIAQDARSWYDE
ncbi:glucose-6-phosphate dehydrogenase [Sulfurospirillum sp. 1612]|uniref:glucose-6-phosphate dehydrogenase n=1 Tax=Sulfurospirillum sp. 1612 TaxID=3094835 RepID=UPI002F926926